MAFASKKLYAILMQSEEGKDILEGISDKSQEEFEKEVDEFFGKGGKGEKQASEYQEAKKPEEKTDRTDKYGNKLVDDKTFDVGVKAAKDYIDSFKDYDKENPLKALKQSNVGLEYLKEEISDAIHDSGYEGELTYQDFDEIIGAATGEVVNTEEAEGQFNPKAWKSEKYKGYNPSNKKPIDITSNPNDAGGSAQYNLNALDRKEMDEFAKKNGLPFYALWADAYEDYLLDNGLDNDAETMTKFYKSMLENNRKKRSEK